MALVVCRRFTGSFCGTFPCPPLMKPRQTRTCDFALTAKKISTDSRMSAALKLLEPLKYKAPCNPAYRAAQSVAHWHMGNITPHGGQTLPECNSSCHLARKVKNVGGTTLPRRTFTASSAHLGLEFNKASTLNASTLHPDSSSAGGGEEDVEVFDSFEGTRVFLKLRPEYQLHSYNRSDTHQPIAASEVELILHKVTFYQNKLQPEVITNYFYKLSSLPAEQNSVLLSSNSFALLCQLSVKNIQLFNTSDLISILKAFVDLRIPPSLSMLDVYETRFCHQVWEMTLDQLLLVADLWRNLGRRVPRFFKIFF